MDIIKNNKNEKIGLVLGTICPGVVPIKWMMHQKEIEKSLPGGLFWSYVYALGDFAKDPTKNYATLRTEVIEKALKMGVKWLMFIDSDVFLPRDAVNRLMSHDVDIVSGVYWMKTDPPQPVIYETIGNGPIWEIKPQETLKEIGGAGLGCCLINMKVFEKFKEANIKLMDQDWEHVVNGKRVQVSVGEDHYFFEKARELGFKVWCDTKVLCDHYDVVGDRFYPDEKIVRNLSQNYLKKEGHGEIINHQINVRNVDKNKPSIVFFNAHSVPFNGNSIKEKPIAGSETALISMAKCMKEQGWNSHVMCNTDKDEYFDNVGYHHFSKTVEVIGKLKEEMGKDIDVFVSSRDIRPFLELRPPAKKTVLWLHDMPNGFKKEDLQKAMSNISHVFFISEFQKNAYQKEYGDIFPKDKIVITRNGIDESRFDLDTSIYRKKRGQCVYTTTPFRGLDVLLKAWPLIKEKVPEAKLDIYSGMSIYNQPEYEHTKTIFDHGKSIASKFDITFHEPVKQDELAKVLTEADVMLYPNHYPETSCLTAMESMKAKTPIITSKFGALPETIRDGFGVLIEGDAHTSEYLNKFVDESVKMLTDDAYRSTFCRDIIDLSWEKVAVEWNQILSEDVKTNLNTPEYWNNKHDFNEKNGNIVHGEKDRFEMMSKIIPKDAYVLDIGCGDGNFLKYLYDNQIGVSLSGIDISEKAIEIAKQKTPLADFSKISQSPCELPVKNMDIITAMHIVEHLDNPTEYVKKWAKSLKKDGEIIVVVPLDDIYFEHVNVYDLAKLEEFARSLTNDFQVCTRNIGWSYPNGKPAKEAILRLYFH